MDLGLRNRHALVLGGTSGIGRAVVKVLVDEGARVTFVGRSARAGMVDTDNAFPVAADLTDPAAPAAIRDAAVARFGPVDVLVLNGGGPPPGDAVDVDGDGVAAATDLLVRPHVELVRRLLPGMRERGWGRIVAVASSSVAQPIRGLAASNIGRAALAGYLETLAAEVAADGVTVNQVLPGRIDTDRVAFIDRANAERSGSTAEAVRAASERAIPAGRYGTPEEFAAVVAFVAGERASYVTGTRIRCDGGLVRAH
jgi:3-oxoacyl-[acyl-carrier protein] reductase